MSIIHEVENKQTNKTKNNILFALFVDGHDTNYVIRIAKGSKELRGHPNLTSFPASFIEKKLGTRLAQAQTGCLPLPPPPASLIITTAGNIKFAFNLSEISHQNKYSVITEKNKICTTELNLLTLLQCPQLSCFVSKH